MIPSTIIDLSHIQEKIQTAIQQLYCKEIHLDKGKINSTDLVVLLTAGSIFNESIGLTCTEIKRDGSHPFGVPLREADQTYWGFETCLDGLWKFV
uniref:Uncharacterized protein n=1 Tax=Mola mola TaxID=94237 RepID=A0A3Q3X719_MOLML